MPNPLSPPRETDVTSRPAPKERGPRLFRIIDRYIIREVLPPTGLGLLVFTFVLLLQQITLLAGLLISRSADLGTTLRLLVSALPSIFTLSLPMSFLLGVLLAFGRLASESEIIALRAGGVSPLQMLRPVLALAVLVGLVTLYTTGVARPWSVTQYRQTLVSLLVAKTRTGVKPRVFTDDLLPGQVLYVSDLATDTGVWKDVFIADAPPLPERPRIILARRGRLHVDERSRTVTLRLEDGHTYLQSARDPAEHHQESFVTSETSFPLDRVLQSQPEVEDPRELSLVRLARRTREIAGAGDVETAKRYRIELHKRLSIPAACLVFGLIGLGFSLGARKEARPLAFGAAIAVISAYYVLLRIGEETAMKGRLSPWLGIWMANLVLGVLGLALVAVRQRDASLGAFWPFRFVSRLPPLPSDTPEREETRPDTGDERAEPGPLSAFVPRLLDRYVAGEYVGVAALVMVGFWATFVLFDAMGLIDDLRHNHVATRVLLHYYRFQSPFIIQLVAPVVALVATLATFAVLSRRNEIVAMSAGGISVLRAALPALVLAGLASLALFGTGEYILPYTNRIAGEYRNVIKGRPPQSARSLEKRWIMGSDGRIYYYDYLSREPSPSGGGGEAASLYGLTVFEIDPATWTLKESLHARVARFVGLTYELQQGWRRVFAPQMQFRAFAEARTREIERPEYFTQDLRATESLRLLELAEHIASLGARGFDTARLEVELHRKLAYPVATLVMTLLGLRFAFTVGRKGTLYGMGLSVAIAIAYWVAINLFDAMGTHGQLPPFLAAWAPDLLFGAAGMYLALTIES